MRPGERGHAFFLAEDLEGDGDIIRGKFAALRVDVEVPRVRPAGALRLVDDEALDVEELEPRPFREAVQEVVLVEAGGLDALELGGRELLLGPRLK